MTASNQLGKLKPTVGGGLGGLPKRAVVDSSETLYTPDAYYLDLTSKQVDVAVLDELDNVYFLADTNPVTLCKANTYGVIEWEITFTEGVNPTYGMSIAWSSYDNTVLVTMRVSTVVQCVLFKVGTDGSIVYKKKFSGVTNIRDIATDSLGNTYVTTVNGTGQLTKLNSSGVVQWTSYNLSGKNNYFSVFVSSTDALYVATTRDLSGDTSAYHSKLDVSTGASQASQVRHADGASRDMNLYRTPYMEVSNGDIIAVIAESLQGFGLDRYNAALTSVVTSRGYGGATDTFQYYVMTSDDTIYASGEIGGEPAIIKIVGGAGVTETYALTLDSTNQQKGILLTEDENHLIIVNTNSIMKIPLPLQDGVNYSSSDVTTIANPSYDSTFGGGYSIVTSESNVVADTSEVVTTSNVATATDYRNLTTDLKRLTLAPSLPSGVYTSIENLPL